MLTFWGFLARGADRTLAPLHAVRPAPVAAPIAADRPIAAPAVAAAAPIVAAATPWWKRWWWWLLLALLLALLLFGLRACVPGLGGMPRLPSLGSPELPAVSPALPDVDVGASTEPRVVDGVVVDDSTASPVPPAMTDDAADQHAEPPVLPSPQAAGTPLAIPAQAPNGVADFLNGDWRVRAGIQDRNTGEPLSLQYQFKDGEGQVTLNRRNGVSCQAPVKAAMADGALLINNGSAATCSDGSTYDMPEIRCTPDNANTAACQGQYGSEQFPLTMRQPQL